MKVESLACGNCGAPLDVPVTANFVRCNHCGSQLAVRRETMVAYTETLQKVAQRADRLTDEVAKLAYQNELARIDREWDREREDYLTRSKDGSVSEPSIVGAVIGMVAAAVVGFVALAAVGGFGLVILLGAIGFSIMNWMRVDAFEKAKSRYLSRRRAVSLESIRLRIAEGSLSDLDDETEAIASRDAMKER